MRGSRRSRGLLAAAVALVVVVGLALGLAGCGSGPGTGSPSPASSGGSPATAGDDAAPFFSGVTLAGDIVALDQYRGKPLLLVYMTYS